MFVYGGRTLFVALDPAGRLAQLSVTAMDSQQSMFLILGAFYLYESLLWLPRGTVAFTARWTGNFRLRHPGRLFANYRGALLFKPFLPPGRRVFLTSPMSIVLSPEGLLHSTVANVSPGEPADTTGECRRWEDVESVVADKRWLKINGRCWFKMPSFHNAGQLAQELEKIRQAAADKREPLLRQWLDAGVKIPEVEKEAARVRRESRRLAVLGAVLFVYLFVGLLPLSFIYSFRHFWGAIIGLAFLQTIPIAWLFYRAHRELYPQAGEERFAGWLTMLLFAPAAVRAYDQLTLPLLYRFHPLAAAISLGREREARAYAAFLLREIKHPPVRPAESEGDLRNGIAEWHRAEMVKRLERCCEQAGWNVADLLRAPARVDPDSKTYCPRCLSEFVISEGGCADCGGVQLVSFAEKTQI